MYAFFVAHAWHIAFEANYQGGPITTDGNYLPGSVVPHAAAAYKAHF